MGTAIETPPAYQQLAQRLMAGIVDNRIAVGERLPSVRELQRSEAIAKNTALAALRLLEQHGYAVAKPRSGYFAALPNKLPKPAALLTRSYRETPNPPLPPTGGVTQTLPSDVFDMSEALVANDLLPFAALNRASRSVLARQSNAIFGGLPPVNGCDELRQAIAARMLRAGAEVSYSEILVTSGATESVSLALRALTQPGDTIAVECPSYFGNRLHTRLAGLALEEIRTDPVYGLDIDHLGEICRQKSTSDKPIKGVLVSANVHNPSGACMPTPARRALLALAETFNFWIIEDDVYGDYARYSGSGISSIKALDTHERVIYCSSFSKTLTAGLRCGWIASRRHFDAIRRLKLAHTLGSPKLNQLTIAKFLATASMENHLHNLVKTLDHTRAAAAHAVARSFKPGTEAAVPQYGFLLWVKLPEGLSSSGFTQMAAAQNIIILPGSHFGPGSDFDQYVRLNLGRRWNDELAAAIETLGKLSFH